jgi:hypothetical protein
MPYIITTHGKADQYGRCPLLSRRAVATLEEARDRTAGEVAARTSDLLVAEHIIRAVDLLPESGGTIGPLPDGTVIEVARVLDQDLVRALPDSVRRDLWRRHAATIPRAELIDAYNAREVSA